MFLEDSRNPKVGMVDKHFILGKSNNGDFIRFIILNFSNYSKEQNSEQSI